MEPPSPPFEPSPPFIHSNESDAASWVRLLLERLLVEAKPPSPIRFSASNTLINVGLVDPGPGARSVEPRLAAAQGAATGGRANWAR